MMNRISKWGWSGLDYLPNWRSVGSLSTLLLPLTIYQLLLHLGLKIGQEIAKLINFELFSCFKLVAYAQSYILVIFLINSATSFKIQGKYLSRIYIGKV